MQLDEGTLENLKKELNPALIKTRPGGSGKALSYLEGWQINEIANEIFGFDKWCCRTIRLEHIATLSRKNSKGEDCKEVGYRATVEIEIYDAFEGSVIRQGSGFGNGIDKNEITAHELALKEAETDAFKRAFKTFGNQFGLCLYDKAQTGVADPEPKKKPAPEISPAEKVKTACKGWLDKLAAEVNAGNLTGQGVSDKFSAFKKITTAKGINYYELSNTTHPEVGTWLLDEVQALMVLANAKTQNPGEIN